MTPRAVNSPVPQGPAQAQAEFLNAPTRVRDATLLVKKRPHHPLPDWSGSHLRSSPKAS